MSWTFQGILHIYRGRQRLLDMSVTTIHPKGGTTSNHPIPKTFIQVLAVCMDKRYVYISHTLHISVGGCSCMWETCGGLLMLREEPVGG